MLWLALVLTGCQSPDQHPADAMGDPMGWAVDEPGPFNVGFMTWEHTYEVPVGESPRTIPINLWYPTVADNGPSSYYLEGLYEDPLAFSDASPAEPAFPNGYPVHVHSHGDRGWGATSANMMRFFASHGWVAIAPDHTDNTLLRSTDPRPTAHYIHRPLDVSATLDALDGASILGSHQSDTSRALLSGHSFGAYTVWANAGAEFDPDAMAEGCVKLDEGECSEDEMAVFLSGELSEPRVSAAITMAGAIRRSFIGDTGHLGVTAPLMLMSGSEDSDGIPDSWESLQDLSPLYWVDIDGGCHQSFAAGVCGSLDAADGFQIINAYALALGRSVVLGDSSIPTEELLSGDQVLSPRVTYSVSSGSK